MSVIICVSEPGALALGTDSRRMTGSFTAIESDRVEKIIELGPQTCLAPMGFRLVTDFQDQKGVELARDTTDIRKLTEALDRESKPVIRQ